MNSKCQNVINKVCSASNLDPIIQNISNNIINQYPALCDYISQGVPQDNINFVITALNL
jgi:hypothetical protein